MKAAKRKRRAKFKAGDRVRVVNPEFFVRCGYPLEYSDVYNKVAAEEDERVRKVLRELGFDEARMPGYTFSRLFGKVVGAITYGRMHDQRFGGAARSIYTQRNEEYRGHVFHVTGVSFVKTGEYVPARTAYGWEASEYEPAYLADEQTHRILDVLSAYDGCDLRIEDVHVELLEGDAGGD